MVARYVQVNLILLQDTARTFSCCTSLKIQFSTEKESLVTSKELFYIFFIILPHSFNKTDEVSTPSIICLDIIGKKKERALKEKGYFYF